jgi:hypothetical protein
MTLSECRSVIEDSGMSDEEAVRALFSYCYDHTPTFAEAVAKFDLIGPLFREKRPDIPRELVLRLDREYRAKKARELEALGYTIVTLRVAPPR